MCLSVFFGGKGGFLMSCCFFNCFWDYDVFCLSYIYIYSVLDHTCFHGIRVKFDHPESLEGCATKMKHVGTI